MGHEPYAERPPPGLHHNMLCRTVAPPAKIRLIDIQKVPGGAKSLSSKAHAKIMPGQRGARPDAYILLAEPSKRTEVELARLRWGNFDPIAAKLG